MTPDEQMVADLRRTIDETAHRQAALTAARDQATSEIAALTGRSRFADPQLTLLIAIVQRLDRITDLLTPKDPT